MYIYIGGMVRMATVADIEQVFSQLSPSHSTRNQSSPTTADIVISASDLELAAELLGYSLSIEEIKDCVLYCTGTPPVVEKSNDTSTGLVVLKYTDKISMQKFASWWNSERCNPNLKSWKATHTTPINRIEGSGTTFG